MGVMTRGTTGTKTTAAPCAGHPGLASRGAAPGPLPALLLLSALVLLLTLAPAAFAGGLGPVGAAPFAVSGVPLASAEATATGSFIWKAPALVPAATSSVYTMTPAPAGTLFAAVMVGDLVQHAELAVQRMRKSDGKLLWRTVYKAPGDVFARVNTMVTAPNGDAVVLGSQKTAPEAGEQWVVLRFRAADGKLLWSAVRGSPDSAGRPTDTSAYGLGSDRAGSVYVGGRTFSAETSSTVGVVVKYSAAGKQVWQHTVTGPHATAVQDIAVDAAGNVYLAGSRTIVERDEAIGQAAVTEGLARKLGTSGAQKWDHPLGDGAVWWTNQVLLAGRDVYLRGSRRTGPGAAEPFVAKLSAATGTAAWTTGLTGIPGQDAEGYDFALDRAGNAFVVGMSWYQDVPEGSTWGNAGWVYKVGAQDGAVLWGRNMSTQFDGSPSGMFWRLQTDAKGRVFCAGVWVAGERPGVSQGIVLRYDANGSAPTQWTVTGSGSGVGASCDDVLVTGKDVFACGELKADLGWCGFVQKLRP